MDSLGVGLASLAFWGFVASAVVGGIWFSIREKQAQHETLRQMIASGKDVDAEVIDRIMSDGGKSETDLKVAGYITMSVAPARRWESACCSKDIPMCVTERFFVYNLLSCLVQLRSGKSRLHQSR